jgi:OmcA/MtrC family decaheme c-type cytochrome
MGMIRKTRDVIICISLAAVLVGCGGEGGNRALLPGPDNRSPGGTPAPVNQRPISDNTTPVAFNAATSLSATITQVDINSEGRPVVYFAATDHSNAAINDITGSSVRFIIAKLQPSELGNLHGTWQSYINHVEQPGVGPGTSSRLQATTERGTTGLLANNLDGTYAYTFDQIITEVSALPADVVQQAHIEALDLGYDAELTHRVSIQFAGSNPSNPSFDFQPSTGATEQIPRALIAATSSCNTCHQHLSLHGGGRTEMDYCVTCHNPGSTDANSGNSVAMDEMIHKIHYGASLPSVIAGGDYTIYGFRDSVHDYSGIRYPRDHRGCTECHAGTATDAGLATPTTHGDHWNEYPTQRACGACHDDLNFSEHYGGQPDDLDCRSCHATGGIAGSVAESHIHRERQAAGAYRFEVLDIQNTAPGEKPVIDFQVIDPTHGNRKYDIKNDAPFIQGGGASRLAATISWSTTDYTNTGNGAPGANAVSIDALASSQNLGDNTFRVTSPLAIPDGSESPFIPASGSGTVTIEGHPADDIGDGAIARIPVQNVAVDFSIDESTGDPVPRRERVDLNQCLDCHDSLALHGNNRTDNLDACSTCHNPRNTDRQVRGITLNPLTDGKTEESLDFKTMIHGIHAASYRVNPLQIVGFGGFSTHIYDETTVHYPAPLSNCKGCHTSDSYALPMAASVLGVSVDTGGDSINPGDDIVMSPATAVCASCHDGTDSLDHMVTHGGDPLTTQSSLDNGITVERCSTCHGRGKFSAVDIVHNLPD